MTTTTRKQRLSPSGEFIGDPGLRVGPGSTGIIFRAHGSGETFTAMNSAESASPGPIDGLTFSADLRPGYKYETRLYTEYRGTGMTGTTQAWALYRTKDAATQAWSAWQRLTGSAATPVNHYVHAAPTTAEAPTGSFDDCLIDMAVTATADAIEFSLLSDSGSGQPTYCPGLSYAIVTEYIV